MRISGILLASGASRRLGKPKQLLIWHGDCLINSIVKTIKASKIDDFYIILGSAYQEISNAVDDKYAILINPDWQVGKSSSMKRGIQEIKGKSDAALFFTTDQPFLSTILIDEIIHTANIFTASAIATRVNGTVTVPMLFKKDLFSQIEALKAEEGGKAILGRFEKLTEFVDWNDERLLFDIDTEEDFHNAQALDLEIP